MKKARLIVTFSCVRDCVYCCNKYRTARSWMTPVEHLEELDDYDEVMITGGEPLLHSRDVGAIITGLQYWKPGRPVYLYTAIYRPIIVNFLRVLDGVHYTIHAPMTDCDLADFVAFQRAIKIHGRLSASYRLCIDPGVQSSVSIQPSLWSRIEVKPWISEADMELPPGEELLVLGKDRLTTYLENEGEEANHEQGEG